MAEIRTWNPNPIDDGPVAVPPPELPSYWNPTATGHTVARYVTSYRGASGWAQVPVAGPGAPAQAVLLHSAVQEKWNYWQVKREDGELPFLPHPEPSANEILTDWEISLASPELDDSGSVRAFTISGYYHYICLAVRYDQDGYLIPHTVTDLGGFGLLTNSGSFVKGVFGPLAAPAGAPPGVGKTGGEGFFSS